MVMMVNKKSILAVLEDSANPIAPKSMSTHLWSKKKVITSTWKLIIRGLRGG